MLGPSHTDFHACVGFFLPVVSRQAVQLFMLLLQKFGCSAAGLSGCWCAAAAVLSWLTPVGQMRCWGLQSKGV